MIHTFPNNYSQNDSRWANILLGKSPTVTLGVAGCYVDAFTNGANYYGHAITPDQMNQKLKDAGLFDGGLISADDDLSKIFPDIQYIGSYEFPDATETTPAVPANLPKLQDLMNDVKITVIVEIDLGNGEVHFCQVVSCDGTNVSILNSWNGQVQDLKSVYGDPATKILKFIVYQGEVATDPAPDTIMEIKQKDFLKLDQKSLELDKIGAFLEYPQSQVDTLGFSEKVIDYIKGLETSTPAPTAPETTQTPDSTPLQPLSTDQTTLLQKLLGLIGLKLESK